MYLIIISKAFVRDHFQVRLNNLAMDRLLAAIWKRHRQLGGKGILEREKVAVADHDRSIDGWARVMDMNGQASG